MTQADRRKNPPKKSAPRGPNKAAAKVTATAEAPKSAKPRKRAVKAHAPQGPAEAPVTAALSAAKNEAPQEPKKPTNSQANGAHAPSGAAHSAHAHASHQHSGKSVFEDFESLSDYVANVTGRSQDVVRDFLVNSPQLKLARGEASDPLNIGEAFQEVMNSLTSDPGTVLQRQFNLWGDYARLMANISKKMAGETVRPSIEPQPGDKRFQHHAWNDNPLLDFVKQSYLTYAKWLTMTVRQLEGMTEHEKKRAEFYTQQFLDAIAPSNFPMLNPEVVETTIETKGENLLKGLKNFLEDLDRGDGALSIRQADLDYFKIGVNIATTPGKVVYQNALMQLIQYAPTTETVATRPLLILPPWINKFYILDLQPENSFIRWMVDQGRTVFVVSWVNPGPELRGKSFEDYIHEGLFAALDAVKQAAGAAEVDAIGYCIGGTMLATALCLMAKTGDKRINSATFFTAQADFTEAGDLALFVDDAQLEAIEKQMDAAGGVLEGRAMATTFNMLRSNDLIWQFVIDNYLKGKEPAKFDLLYWNSDATRMPKAVHLFYLREFYQKNRLANGGMAVDGELLDLGDVAIPVFLQAGETDHIAPAKSVYNTAKLLASGGNSKVEYMLAGSGHIAGVINHPSKNKYHHSTNKALPETLDEWRADAVRHKGSWWIYWMEWLNRVSPGTAPARIPGAGKLKPIEDAPGSYVKVKG